MLMVFVLLMYIFTSSLLCVNVQCLLGDNIEVQPYCKIAHNHPWLNISVFLPSLCVQRCSV